jgi:hypothetical protein
MLNTKPTPTDTGHIIKQLLPKVQLMMILLLFLPLSNANSQETFDAAGGEATGSGGSASYSFGQVFYYTNTGSYLFSAAEGVQQPYEISIHTGLNDTEGISLVYQVYPNPTRDILNLKIENYYADELMYQLVNMNGDILESNSFSGTGTSISMAGYVNAVYLLRIIDREKSIKVFKIIKR